MVHAGCQTLPPAGLVRIVAGVIFLDLGQLGSLLDGIVQRTDGINQLDFQGIIAYPYMTLGNFLHLCNRKLAAISHTLAEQLIATTNILIEQR